MGTLNSVITSAVVLLVTLFTEFCQAGTYCHYLHEDYYTYRTVYCDGGCCNDYGEDDDICCFSWTVGMILGIALGCIGFIVLIIVALICCHQMKKRSGHVIHPGATSQPVAQTNTVVYTAASAPPYPYPQYQGQPAYYPGSYQYNQPPGTAPPPYTAGTQPAYMPNQQFNPPTNTGNGNRNSQTTTITGSDPVYPPPSQPQMHGGYGTGQNGAQT